jgi:NADH-quinone oxidoreductase subunit M
VLLAGALLKMGTYGMVRVVLPVVPEGAEAVAPYLGALGVVGILYGSFACLAQTDLKRLIAYSSVGHMGFVLLGISTLTPAGINGALYANIAHGLITGLLFFVVGGIKDRHGSSSFTGVGRALYARAPRLGALLAFAAVASLGLPGLAGFWGEMLALLGAYDPAGPLPRSLYLTLMALAGLGTVLTAAYLLQAVRRVCQGPVDAVRARVGTPDVRPVEALTWGPLVLFVVLLGVWPGLLLGLTNPAVGVLLRTGS